MELPVITQPTTQPTTQPQSINWKAFTSSDSLLQPNDPEKPYHRKKGQKKTAVQWGQRKLAMSLIQFLTTFWDKNQIPNPVLLYIGSAPGNNIEFVMRKLFSEFVSVLVDPRPMKVTESEWLRVVPTLFTEEMAQQWKGRSDVFLVSDIRSVGHSKVDLITNEKEIWGDMELQQKIYEIIKPVRAQLKFRLPYYSTAPDWPFKQLISYTNGYVFKGIWSPQTSTETRLVPFMGDELKNYSEKIMWDTKKYESQMFYFNNDIREETLFYNPFFVENSNESKLPISSIINQYTEYQHELLNDYDSVAEIHVWMNYLLKRGGKEMVTSENVIGLSNSLTADINKSIPLPKDWITISKLRLDPILLKKCFF